MKILMLALLLFQQPLLITEYDEFNEVTTIKTDKLYVLDSETEKMQFTFIAICKGNQTKDCGRESLVSIGLLIGHDYLKYSKSLKAIADGERFDLGEATELNNEPKQVGVFLGLALTIPASTLQKFGDAKSLKMQLGGALSFSFNSDQIKAIRALSLKLKP